MIALVLPAKWRRVVYVVTLVLMVGLIAFGKVTPDDLQAAVDTASRVVATLATLLALLNVTPDE